MINYFTQVTFCWGLFYLLYTLWLRKETFFKANRWYLLTTLLAGLAIPLIEFSIFIEPQNLKSSNILETITVTAQAFETNLEEIVITPVNNNWSMQMILLSIYWLGVLFFASRFLYGMFQIFKLAYNGKIVKKKGYFLVSTNTIHLPFSFMDYLFWSTEVNFEKEDHEKVLRHELCHIKGNHSIDVLITEILCIFLWCSPFIFLYKKALKNIHEYLADDAVLTDTPTKKYGQLLLKQSQSGLQIAQANNFIHSQLKKRILMMTKTKSQQYALLKYIAILPLALVLVFSISAKNSSAGFQNNATTKLITQDTLPVTSSTSEDDVFKVVEEMPRFPGCEDQPKAERKSCADKKMLEHIYSNIKYPALARESNIQGTTVVQFIVEKDGRITNLKMLRSIGGGCDEEVLRVVGTMPNWIAGKQSGQSVRVQFNLPVKFKLDADAPKDPASNLHAIIDKKFPDGAPLIYVDEKEVSDINTIAPNDIKEIHVVKGEVALKQYGDRAKDGVIIITTQEGIENPTYMDGKNIPPAPPAPPTPPSSIPPPPPPPPPVEESNEIIKVVEKMPMFPGTTDRESSNKELLNFVYTNLKYPKAAQEANIQGTTVVNFVITKEGRIKTPKMLRSIGGGTDEEVLRVVELINELPENWTPGTQRGIAVDIQYNLPVKFKLDDSAPSDKVLKKDQPQIEGNSSFEKIDIYPNPSSGTININSFSVSSSPTTVTIVDSKGTQLYSQDYDTQEIKITDLVLKNAASGLLFVSFKQDGKTTVREVVLQR